MTAVRKFPLESLKNGMYLFLNPTLGINRKLKNWLTPFVNNQDIDKKLNKCLCSKFAAGENSFVVYYL